jgi:hypothetical protein
MVSSEARAVVSAEAIEDLGFEWVREQLGELFGVNKQLYTKLINSDKQLRFAKRKIFGAFLYRKSKSGMKAA